VWSDDGKSIIVVAAEEGRVNFKRIDAATGAITPMTTGNHDIQSYSIRGGKTVALVSTPTIVGDLYLVGSDGAMTRLTDVNHKLMSELTLTEPDELWYTSFDGKKIQTWIQKPADFDASKKYPLILNIHGGPHSAYGYTFDHEFQWMAAKGYVVLYPNPRGSTSYGQEFGNVIQYHYPGDDFKDLMAGVDAVVAKGYIDPKKLCVTGGSGGGLLTDWVVTQTDRFAAAAAQRDIADWSTFWYTADFSLFQPTWFRKAPWEDPKDYAARSPITYIERVKTPLMLILGEADYRTPPMAGGEMMFRALKYRHIPTVMVRFPDESHELSRSGKPWHRIERLQHIVGWFDHWVMGVPKPEYEAGLRK
jgi:dipeptidyl aminopeptidase/acylaminoacyl peptidase